MDVMELARRHVVRQTRISSAAMLAAIREWKRLDGSDLSGSWTVVGPRVKSVLAAGQLAAAAGASDYVSAAVRAQGLDPQPDGSTQAAAFAGWAADGRSLDTLMLHSLITTKQAIADGTPLRGALQLGENWLSMAVSSEVADAGRSAEGVGMTADRTVTAYVRVLGGRGCARCVILAGQIYVGNPGFLRHPRCQCRHLPVADQGRMRPHLLDPHQYFEQLSRAEQDRRFTAAGAQAIRDGGNINAIVNARRGMYRAADGYGRRVRATREGTTRRGLYFQMERSRAGQVSPAIARNPRLFELTSPRLMPEQIYRIARTRDEAVDLLRQYGYLGWSV